MTPRKLRAAIASLQTQLDSSKTALMTGDAEALHSLRVTLRQLCSLLKPLAALPDFGAPYAHARELARATSPLRDEEVLCTELALLAPALAARRQQALDAAYRGLHDSPVLAQCMLALGEFLATAPFPDKATLKSTLAHALRHWQRQLHHALQEQAALAERARDDSDLPAREAAELHKHRLRLLIKRLRYSLAVWQKSSPRTRRLLKALRKCQDSLGDWHDRIVWLERSREEADLLPFVATWEAEKQLHAVWADAQLAQLQKPLRRWQQRQKKSR
jgi:CHAD domain-containing protein